MFDVNVPLSVDCDAVGVTPLDVFGHVAPTVVTLVLVRALADYGGLGPRFVSGGDVRHQRACEAGSSSGGKESAACDVHGANLGVGLDSNKRRVGKGAVIR